MTRLIIIFNILLYCFAFFEVGVPGYTQTFHDVYDNYVVQKQDTATSNEEVKLHPNPALILAFVNFCFHSETAPLFLKNNSTDKLPVLNKRIYLKNSVFLI